MPAVGKRIAEAPSVVKHFSHSDGPGRSGGQANILVARARHAPDELYSNARLIVYDDQFKLQADILESYEDKAARSP